MLHLNYDKYIKEGVDSISMILNDYKVELERITTVRNKLINNECSNTSSQRQALSYLGGTLISLKPVYLYVISTLMDEQNKKIVGHQNDYVKSPTHVKTKNAKGEEIKKLITYSSTVGKAFAQKETAKLREVSNILRGYVESAETNIMVLQSLLKSSVTEGLIYDNEEEKTDVVGDEGTYVLGSDNDENELM